MATSFPLPLDIMAKIFQLLPTESILSCKFVSKEWRKAIALYNPDSKRHASFFLDKNNLCYLLINNSTNIPKLQKIPIPIKNSTDSDQLLNSGPSNGGLVCINSTSDCFLFLNLFIGASFEVEVDSSIRGHNNSSSYSWGFGYDRYSDDHKIVVLCKSEDKEDEFLGWVYRLRNCIWKRIEGPIGYPYYDLPDSGGYCLNGILHWIIGESWNMMIVTNDLVSLEFGSISLPDDAGGASLGELNGRLCCYCLILGWKFEVWVMNEYGVKESWEKLVAIDSLMSVWKWIKP